MARQRLLHPDFFTDSELLALSPLHRLLFAGLWGLADRDGRLRDKPLELKIKLLPVDQCDVSSMLDDLADSGRIVRYRVEGMSYIAVSNFGRYQHPHKNEPESEIPPPTDNRAEFKDSRNYPSAPVTPDMPQQSVPSTRAESVTESVTESVVVPAAPGGSQEPLRLEPTKAKRERAQSKQERLASMLGGRRLAHIGDGATPDLYPVARVNRMFGPLVEQGLPDEAWLSAFDLFLEADRPAGLDPPYPLWAFATDWPQYLSKASRGLHAV